MTVLRSPSFLNAVKTGYEGNGEFVVLGLQVRKSQREMLKALSQLTGESQATILRAIIDEWSEFAIAAAQEGQE